MKDAFRMPFDLVSNNSMLKKNSHVAIARRGSIEIIAPLIPGDESKENAYACVGSRAVVV